MMPWILMAVVLIAVAAAFAFSLRSARRRDSWPDITDRRRAEQALERACRD